MGPVLRCDVSSHVLLHGDSEQTSPSDNSHGKRGSSGRVWPDELTDAAVEIFASEEKDREQRRKKREKGKAGKEGNAGKEGGVKTL